MNHEEWQILVSAYKDGEVSAEERAQVEAHLATCRECAAALAAYRRLGQAVAALPRGAPSRALWLRVRERLSSRRRWSLWQRLVPVASAAALLLVGITLVIALGRVPQAVAPLGRGPVGQAELVALPSAAPQAPLPEAPPPALDRTYEATPTVVALALEGAVGPCPGQPLALEIVSLSVRSDAALAAPRLVGVLFDAQDRPLADVALVISGTAGWQGSAVSAADGTFVVDLPEAGRYRVVLALATAAAKAGAAGEADVSWNHVVLRDGMVCQAPLSTALAPVSLGPHDEVRLTLRAR